MSCLFCSTFSIFFRFLEENVRVMVMTMMMTMLMVYVALTRIAPMPEAVSPPGGLHNPVVVRSQLHSNLE